MMTQKLLDLLNKKELYKRSKEYMSHVSQSKIEKAIDEILRQIDVQINDLTGQIRSNFNTAGT